MISIRKGSRTQVRSESIGSRKRNRTLGEWRFLALFGASTEGPVADLQSQSGVRAKAQDRWYISQFSRPDRHSGPTLGSVRDCVYRRLADQNSRGFTRRQRLQNLQKPLLEVLEVLAATSARVGILPRARIVGIVRPPARRKLRRLFSVKR
jgi:hypothetical protein